MLDRQPGRRVRLVGDVLGCAARPGRGQRQVGRVAERVQEPVGGVRGVQVVVDDPAGRLPAFLLGVVRAGEVGGVGAQQVVHGVPAAEPLRRQVGADQLGQQRYHLGRRDAREAGGGRRGEIGAGMVAE